MKLKYVGLALTLLLLGGYLITESPAIPVKIGTAKPFGMNLGVHRAFTRG